MNILKLFILAAFKLFNFQLDFFHALIVKLFPISKEEQNLQNNKQWSCDESLVQGVQESRSSSLKHSMTNKLKQVCFDLIDFKKSL